MRQFRKNGTRGSVLFITLFTLTVMFTFGIAFLALSSTQLTTAKRDTMRARALDVAEAGVQRAISYLRDTAPDGSTDGSWRTFHPSEEANNHNGDTWYSETLGTGETFRLCVRDGTDINTGKIVITSIGTVTMGGRATTRTIEAVVAREEENVSIWNNVIFADVGQAGKSINGNVVMRGSIHLLGNGEDYTDVDGDGHWDAGEPYGDSNHNGQYDAGEPYVDTDGDGHRDGTEPWDDVNGNGIRDPELTVTDIAEEISGTADVGNNYSGMSAGLRAKLPALPTVWWGGEMVQSLSAKLRCKHGRVNISGSAVVGYPNSPGGSPALKETMNGVYVSDGWGGTRGAAGVNSDNGYNADYDLGDGLVEFPALTDPYTDPNTGASYATYMNYLNANATVVAGPLNLAPGTAYSVSGPNGSLTIDGSGNMTISGIVYVTGDINLNRTGGNTLTYRGSGTLVSTGSIYIHTNLVPRGTFPTTDAIGMIARRRLELATGPGDSQLTLTGAFYAQERVVSQKQSEIAGTLVSSYFSMQNVPHLYQVPALADHLPPGLPGSDPIYVITINVVSWREL